MGACPCFAGAAKAIDAPKPAAKPEAPKVNVPAATKAEAKPLLEPTTLPPTKVKSPDKLAEAPKQETPKDVAATGDGSFADSVGVGTCMEIYSNSYKAWCPGVVFGLDNASILVAYQVPGEPAEANISTKTLPIDSEELRMPTETGSWKNASVEVYSHSNKAWCIGKVTEIEGSVLSVVFFYPNEPPEAMPVMKKLPFGDNDLRLRGIDAAFSMPAAGLGHETLQVSSAVEVYSNSLGVWCPGAIQELTPDGEAVIAFYYPDMDPNNEEPVTKQLPLGHQDLRVPGFVASPTQNDGTPVTEADIYRGGPIEVFSQSRQAWILATICDIQEGMVTVQLRYPDMPPDSELYEKVLPVGHPDLRLPVASAT